MNITYSTRLISGIVLLGILMVAAFPTYAGNNDEKEDDNDEYTLPQVFLPPDQPVLIQVRPLQNESYACAGEHFEFMIYNRGNLNHPVGHTYYRINNWVGTPVPDMVVAWPHADFGPPTSPNRPARFLNRLFFEGKSRIRLRVPMNQSSTEEFKYFFIQVYTHEPSVLIDSGESIATGIIAPCRYRPER
ncbi:MAG: hypothetical protein OXF73_09050 [Gammaproteobacteria bacterium]|nr:hypothetical protein [Gammaproteobacteria bacterium]MCY4228603.1 hypothetical protein [Gammaproteobacteria bacterium]